LFESLEKAFRRGFYDDEADATTRAIDRKAALDRDSDPDVELDPLDIANGFVRKAAVEVEQ
jgi:DNA sulfur modification protein DndC